MRFEFVKLLSFSTLAAALMWSNMFQNSWADAPDAPEYSAKPYDQADFTQVNDTVRDTKSLNELFTYLRDEQFLDSEKTPGMKRRIPWLYLKNGCSDRATLMRQLIEKKHLTTPTRIFAFATEGRRLIGNNPYFKDPISWGEYHTALVTRVEGQVYVIDPGLEPTRPLLVNEWVTRLGGGDPRTVLVSVCGPLSSSAERSCWEKDPQQAYKILATPILLDLELDSIKDLKPEYSHDPVVVLGNMPPWRAPSNNGVGVAASALSTLKAKAEQTLSSPETECGH